MAEDSLVYKLYRTRIISELTHSQLYFLKKEMRKCRSALDIGCGSDSPLRHIKIPRTIGVDIFEPAVISSRKKKIHNEYIIADANNLEFEPRSFDAVILCDALEHLDKEKGQKLLDNAERWANKKVLISCPNGYLPQPALYGNHYQIHRSGWSIEEMRNRGYKAYGMIGLKWKPSRFLFLPLFIWALVSTIAQPITYYFPSVAFEVFYVKNKKA